jgi:integrase
MDAINEEGKLVPTRPRHYIGPAAGTDKISREAAQDIADNGVLKQLNRFVQQPQSIVRIAGFVEQKFIPEWVEKKKCAGKEHYQYCLKKAISVIGDVRLRDFKVGDVRRLCTVLEQQGCSPKTVKNVKTAVVTVINFAKQEGYFCGDNPAQLVRLEASRPKERYSYSFEDAQLVLAELGTPVAEMVFTSMTTSLNVAELCGLRNKRLNLTGATRFSAGEAIPPFSALVRENYYRNTWGTVKTGKRYRTVGLPDYVVERLLRLAESSPFKGPNDPVFASRAGTPMDAHNVNNRAFKKVSNKLNLPVTWHIFRHSAASFVEAMDMPLSDREKIMGHANAQQTMHYTHSDVARRRKNQNQLAERIIPERDKRMRDLMRTEVAGPKQ